MPQIIQLFGYIIYFWSNEGNEPVHVHVCKGKPTPNATKIWVKKDGPQVEHNRSRIPKKDLKLILSWLAINANRVITRWHEYFDDKA